MEPEPYEWDSYLKKETPESSVTASTMQRFREQTAVYEPGSRLTLDTVCAVS